MEDLGNLLFDWCAGGDWVVDGYVGFEGGTS